MIRLLLSILCALGLAFAPVTAGAAMSPSDSMADCAMDKQMPDMPADHSKMDCCTPACPVSSAAAFLPRPNGELLDSIAKAELTMAPTKELVSTPTSGLDPPPRA